ncbi:MAG: formyltransferase family protein [Chloroflexota bacterium]
MRTLLICHEGAEIDQGVLARWMASFSELGGIIVLREKKSRLFKRIRKEIKRSGLFRFADIIAFRIYYKLFRAGRDRAWERGKFDELYKKYPALSPSVKILYTHSPNSPESINFISAIKPDIILARCKQLLKKNVFSIPSIGTFVLHPGVTPEYRNAYGCFWAIASGDYSKVGTTLLKIDEGIDTGPVYGYYCYDWDVLRDSHLIIQHRTVLDNLDDIKNKLIEICAGQARSIDTRGRRSQVFGQPWLTKQLSIISNAKKGKIKNGKAYESDDITVSRHRT